LTLGAGGRREAAVCGIVEVLAVLSARKAVKKIRVHY